MASEVLQSPLWILKPIQANGLKVGMIIVELPEHVTLQFLDENGHFGPAILNQVMQIVMMLRGETPNGGLMNAELMDKFPEFPVDEDLILLQFQKHYSKRSQTMALALNSNAQTQAESFSDQVATSRYFQEAEFQLRYAMNILLEPTNIVFTLYGEGDPEISEAEVDRVKATLS